MYNLTKEFMGIPEKIILRSDRKLCFHCTALNIIIKYTLRSSISVLVFWELSHLTCDLTQAEKEKKIVTS